MQYQKKNRTSPGDSIQLRHFEFPVPVHDRGEVGTAIFMAEDKALLYMRYIRKHIEMIIQTKSSQNCPDCKGKGERLVSKTEHCLEASCSCNVWDDCPTCKVN